MASSGSMFGGSLSFDHRTQEWSIFQSRFVQYCAANDIDDNTDKTGIKRRALLLTALAEDTYRIAIDLTFPTSVEVIDYKALIKILNNHFKSKKSSFGERLKFNSAQQRPGEELAEWAARVRNLAKHCGYKTELETMLRDRFVLGMVLSKEKEKLFAESVETLTFNQALEIAQGVQCARQALQGVDMDASGGVLAQPVFSLRTERSERGGRSGDGGGGGGGTGGGGAPRPGSAPAATARFSSRNGANRCDVCGYKNHSKDKCRYAEFTCRKCNQKGHLLRMCKSNVKTYRGSDKTYEVDDVSIIGSFEQEYEKSTEGQEDFIYEQQDQNSDSSFQSLPENIHNSMMSKLGEERAGGEERILSDNSASSPIPLGSDPVQPLNVPSTDNNEHTLRQRPLRATRKKNKL
ncbi:uncharacterized protein LOC128201814 [Galleria mellonella]|uniref:Uncharacterized protein LOC128201814 n=1 Tax=Galleria mellonella TaxID=7137 RepID=A0ABM3MXH6_GALME|nr:uncharacterized protein LOC128201814 [Galleria mellonella]